MNEIDWDQLKKTAIKTYNVCESYVEHLNWTIIGAIIFAMLLIYYIYDSMSGSQVSGWFVLIVMAILIALGVASTMLVSTFG